MNIETFMIITYAYTIFTLPFWYASKGRLTRRDWVIGFLILYLSPLSISITLMVNWLVEVI